VPALLGAAALVAADGHGLDRGPSTVAAAALVTAVRVLGIWRDWHAPVAPRRGAQAGEGAPGGPRS
jgi:hypothetical protein